MDNAKGRSVMMTAEEVDAIVGVILGAVDGKLAELRIEMADLRSVLAQPMPALTVDDGRVAGVEAAVEELVTWANSVRDALSVVVQEQQQQQTALIRLLAGGSTAEWRAFVVREASRLGVGPKELGLAARQRGEAEQVLSVAQAQEIAPSTTDSPLD